MKTYNCKKCKNGWGFYPEDFNYDKKNYPTYCPLCSMPVMQMAKEVFKNQGLVEVLRMLPIRIKG